MIFLKIISECTLYSPSEQYLKINYCNQIISMDLKVLQRIYIFYFSITDYHVIFIQLKSVNWSSDETPSPVKQNVRTTQFLDEQESPVCVSRLLCKSFALLFLPIRIIFLLVFFVLNQ